MQREEPAYQIEYPLWLGYDNAFPSTDEVENNFFVTEKESWRITSPQAETGWALFKNFSYGNLRTRNKCVKEGKSSRVKT